MNAAIKRFAPLRERLLPWLAIVVILGFLAIQLDRQGRIAWCACGRWFPWDGDIWSAHNSQHLFDPYSFTHILHGVLLCGVIAWSLPRLSRSWRGLPLLWQLVVAIGAEAAWEALENSRFIIQRYRTATIGIGYEGDSIANSMADVLCCALGFLIARRLGLRWSIVFFVAVEVGLLVCVRDNLTLNVLMLIHPVDAIKAWQMGR
ncbi:MAG: DUF2585 family protein [Lentisphaerae bacterium]|nr:DUF2585 family protein [Lentisphaerota bacterium]